MQDSAPKSGEPQADVEDEPQPKRRGRKGLIPDEFEMDCWEPSLRDKLRKAGGPKGS